MDVLKFVYIFVSLCRSGLHSKRSELYGSLGITLFSVAFDAMEYQRKIEHTHSIESALHTEKLFKTCCTMCHKIIFTWCLIKNQFWWYIYIYLGGSNIVPSVVSWCTIILKEKVAPVEDRLHNGSISELLFFVFLCWVWLSPDIH